MALDRTLKKRLALTTAMLSVIGGYSRRAYADCTQTSAGTYICAGTLTTPLVLNGTPLTVTTTSPFSMITTSGDALQLRGTGGVSFTDNSASTITGYNYGIKSSNSGTGVLSITTGAGGSVSGGGVGIGAKNYGTGALSITANGDVVSAASGFAGIVGIINDVASTGALSITTGTNSSVTGGFDGIYAVNLGTGALSITANGTVTGGATGISAEILNAASTGALTITTTAGSTVTGGADGILAYSAGAGAISVSANGVVSGGVSIVANGNVNSAGTASDGIFAAINNTASTGGLAITAGAGGSVIGGNHGIFAHQSGTGALSITANGIVTGSFIGIYAYNRGAGALSITTGAGGRVTGGTYGIYAKNYGTGALSITASGDVTSTTGGGIYAKNTTAGTDLIINAAAVSGGSFGIGAEKFGTGALSITANGNVISTSGVGIFAGNYSGTDLSVIAAAVSGGTSGIVASNAGTGATSVIATGDVTGMADYGILAVNGTLTLNSDGTIRSITATNGTDLSVTAGNVTGGTTGIFANNTGTGALSIIANGNVTGSAVGIYAAIKTAASTGALTITTGAGGSVTGGTYGIYAKNYGTGALSITSSGTVTGTNNDGIFAFNGAAGTALTISTAGVSGVANGIDARNFGTDTLSITTTGIVTGGTGTPSNQSGIYARNYGTGALLITSAGAVTGRGNDGIWAKNYGTDLTINANDVNGVAYGIKAQNYGTGALSITTTGTVAATIDGIHAKNYGTGLIINAAAANGVRDGIYAYNVSTGALLITTTGTVTGTTNAGIYANQYGVGALSITANGNVTGGTFGIRANNNGTAFTITTAAGSSVTGGLDGIYADQFGNGALSITANGNVTGTNGDGIYAWNTAAGTSMSVVTGAGTITGGEDGIFAAAYGTGDLSITTGAGGSVIGGISGILAKNYGTGALSITATGAVTGASGEGIYAYNSSAGTGLTITTDTGSSVAGGGGSGIHAVDFGTGGISITANGNVTGTSDDGIYAFNNGTGALSVIANGNVTGSRYGINAQNSGTGALSITINGTVIGTGRDGIFAYNTGPLSIIANGDVTGSKFGIDARSSFNSSSDQVITTAAGSTVTGGESGIYAEQFGTRALSITANGNVTGTSGDGIYTGIGNAGSTGALTITVGMGSSVAGGRNGIYAFNLGTGALSITANGTVTGGVNGIYAYNDSTAGGVSITAGGTVTGTSGYGIEALNTGRGPTAITVNTGGVVQGAVAGIFVDPVAPIAITNAGTIQNLSGVSDALAIKTAGAPTTITNSGTITGVVALGDLGNSFSNSGTWNTAGGSNAFGALVGGNSLTNQAGGTIIAASAGSTAAQTTSFNHVGTFTNAGLVTLQNGFAGDRAIVQGNFVGTGGTVALDTVLGADNSATDQLVLNGGQASGTTLLKIANAGGSGAQTTGDSIAVVVAQNGATSSAGAFKLNGQVAAGAYQYELFEGGNAMTGGNPNDENWYLRDTLIVTPPPPDDTSGGTPPPPPTVPNYRDEVPVYLAMPELANTVSLAMIGTYDTRMGGDRESVGTLFAPDTQPLVWGRLLGATGQQKPGDQTGLNTSNDVLNGKGPRYGYDYVGLQLGMDLLRKASSDGSHDHVGAYGGLVHATADVDAIYDTPGTSTKAGTLDMDAYSLGLYWTHFGVSGWYSDVVMQGTWFGKVKGQTVNTAMDVQGAAFTASLEGGYPFRFAESWTVEPQGQIVFQHQSLGDGVDHFGLTSFDDVNDARGRIGTKISQTRLMGEGAIPLTLWARADLWHDFAASNPSATFANLSGGNPVTLDGSLRGTWAQIDAGVSGHLTQSISVSGSLFYEHAIDGTQSWSAGGSGGMKSTGVKIGAQMQL